MKIVITLLYFLVAILILVFATQNMSPVTIFLVAGPPLNVPVVVIVGVSFFLGYAVALFGVVMRATKGSKKKLSKHQQMGQMMRGQ